MEEKKGIISYFGGIARFGIFLLLVALVVFFAVRWVYNWQTHRKAEQAVQPTAQQVADNATSQEINSPNTDSADSSPNNAVSTSVPGGIADQVPQTGPSDITAIPDVGMDIDVLFTIFLSSSSLYLFLKYQNDTLKLRKAYKYPN